MTQKSTKKFKTIDLVYIGLFAALIAVCAWIAIPLTVSVTLQTLGVCLAGGLLGCRRATLATVIYVLLGIIGLPVFTGFGSGISAVSGPTGGYIIGFCANFLFAAVQIGGEFVSIQIGVSMSQVLDPTTGESTQILSQMYTYLATMVFIGLNAHQWLFAAIYKSFQAFPPGIDYFFTGSIVSQVLHMSSEMFAIGISMILPIFCVMFVSEVLMGFMSKMMPQMNIFMVAIPLKIYIGIILILLSLRRFLSITGYADAIISMILVILGFIVIVRALLVR